jgi:hypothetical protein
MSGANWPGTMFQSARILTGSAIAGAAATHAANAVIVTAIFLIGHHGYICCRHVTPVLIVIQTLSPAARATGSTASRV